METRHYLTCLWPGLAEVWWRGRLSALPAAIGFAMALNLLLVTRFLYPEWMSSGLVSMAFWIGLIGWVFYLVRSIRELPKLIAPRRVSDEPDRFAEAHTAYLRGQWEEAEDLLTDVLAIEPRDPPALLLLTGVYRHTDRLESAEVLLSEIKQVEVCDRWWLEVEAEAGRLDQARQRKRELQEELEQEKTKKNDAADLTEPEQMAA